MKLPRSAPRKARIEIIPMIDTMFFLLVFFMLASLSMTHQYSVPVNLPKAAGVPDKVPEVVTVTITQDGKLFYNKEAIASPGEAVLRLLERKKSAASLAVIINADRGVRHGRVVELLDAIQQSGLTKIAIAVNHSRG
ncbi:biopolymer transport protein ExbD [Hydrogenispora ethanolica]|jgi:biopolymer transport protein ExbD|uniref:Biopolymer transport protein ExbD n=1 Tax=Hydrogenispora ethanolica TaxID=1082276 RepID=A0A4V2QF59_HYDET|nr:biopolymer transporter ExbD [Hydrogenispora ethanolica]TCL70697.1 biopolymer transport protein ExbD [Hydrogenispora ethanolica]